MLLCIPNFFSFGKFDTCLKLAKIKLIIKIIKNILRRALGLCVLSDLLLKAHMLNLLHLASEY
jgi:hypothetical protein